VPEDGLPADGDRVRFVCANGRGPEAQTGAEVLDMKTDSVQLYDASTISALAG
jgi:hypothetical protein